MKSRFYMVFDGRAVAYESTDRATCLEAMGPRAHPPWREAKKNWGQSGSALVSYAYDEKTNILTDEQILGEIY